MLAIPNEEAAISQGEPRDDAVNVDTYWIFNGIVPISAVSLPQHGFLVVYTSDHSNAKITRSTLIFTTDAKSRR